jgi:hypothetical protein
MFVDRASGRIAESVGGMMVGPARQELSFDFAGVAYVRTATDQSAGQPIGRAHKPGPAGEFDKLPPIDRTVVDSKILSDSTLFHTPSLALMVADRGKNAKKIWCFYMFCESQ